MAYTKPMTPQQRAEAAAAYRSFRRNLKQFRKEYPPRNRDERDALFQYHEAIKAMGLEVAKPVDWIEARKLNRLENAARTAMFEYIVRYEL